MTVTTKEEPMTNEQAKTLAAKIKECREFQEMTQREFGDFIGVDSITISRWERGVLGPSKENLPAVAKALGTTVDALLSEETTQ